MASGQAERTPAALDPGRWFGRLASVAEAELGPALDEIAERVREAFPADVVAVELVEEGSPGDVTHGYSVGDSPAARALAPLLTPDGLDPIGLGEAARRAGRPVVWPRLVSEPEEIERLARLARTGGPAGTLHRLMLDGGGLAVPFGTPQHPGLGSIALVSLARDRPVPERWIPELQALAAPIAMAARTHQLAARTRRTRQTLEGVVSSSRMGVLVSDLRGRLSIANRAAGELLGLDLGPLLGMPVRELLAERLKWRFTNPDEYEARMLALYDDPAREDEVDVETVEGQTIVHHTAPVRDVSGALIGRVEILTDVTPARQALADARRLAAERAELLAREERRAQEEVSLTRAAHMMASALTRADIHDHLLDQAMRLVPGCEKAAVLTLERSGMVVPVATHGFADDTVRRMIFNAAGEGVIGRVLTSRRPFICNDSETDARVSSRIVRPEGIRSFMHVPLILGERVYGLLSVNSARPRAFGERELHVLTELCRHAAAALQNALQYEQERHIAETLQQALLAEELPEVPGLQLAALYQAAAGAEVGGDFYNAWRLPDGRLALLVGDVSGKGVEAAGITAMVRYMAEALGQRVGDPAALVAELNELLAARLPEASLVTLLLAVIDPARDELAWCSAGHPPAVLIAPDGALRALEDPDPPCGAFTGLRFHTHRDRFAPGDVLVAYTDGLIEARRGMEEFGEEGLRAALAEAAGEEPASLARSVYGAARAFAGGRLSDDVAIAVARRTER